MTGDDQRTCKTCGKTKAATLFYAGQTCRVCRIKRQKVQRQEWIAALDMDDDDDLLAYLRRILRTNLKNRYGLTPEEAFEFYKRRVCDVCGKKPIRRRLHDLDHCHETGIIRGLLCSHHNRVLGFIGEEPETLDALVNYLARARDLVGVRV